MLSPLVGLISTSVLFALGAVLLGLVVPLLATVHCLRNPGITTGGKIAWVVLILLSWPIGAAFYGIFGSERPALKTIGYVLVLLIIVVWTERVPISQFVAWRQTELLMAGLDKVQLTNVTEFDRSVLKAQVASLDLSNQHHDEQLKLLSLLLRDNQLDRTKLAQWYHYYVSRNAPNDVELKQHILKLETTPLLSR